MTKEKFLFYVDEIANEQPKYEKGRSAEDGYCDCIGLIIGALARGGVRWQGTHGTNFAVRYVTPVSRITDIENLEIGDLVYKAYEPGSIQYNLPSAYAHHKDQRDYYHVGVVVRASPELQILHMTSPTIKRDYKIGNWKYTGKLPYLGEDEPMAKAYVQSEDGNAVKLRQTPDTTRPYLEKIPTGTEVDILDKGDEWCRVHTLGMTGYMMTKFLRFADAVTDATDINSLICEIQNHVLAIQNILNKMAVG